VLRSSLLPPLLGFVAKLAVTTLDILEQLLCLLGRINVACFESSRVNSRG